jgi:hypothetical protein
VENNYRDIESIDVKKLFINGAIRDEGRVYPNKEWGYGKVNIYQVFDNLR